MSHIETLGFTIAFVKSRGRLFSNTV